MEGILDKLKEPTIRFCSSLCNKIEMEMFDEYLVLVRKLLRQELQEQAKNSNFLKRTILHATFDRIDEIIGLIYDNILDKKCIPAMDCGLFTIQEDIPFDENFFINVLTKIKVSNVKLNIYLAKHLEKHMITLFVEPLLIIDETWRMDSISNKFNVLYDHVQKIATLIAQDNSKRKSDSKVSSSPKRKRFS